MPPSLQSADPRHSHRHACLQSACSQPTSLLDDREMHQSDQRSLPSFSTFSRPPAASTFQLQWPVSHSSSYPCALQAAANKPLPHLPGKFLFKAQPQSYLVHKASRAPGWISLSFPSIYTYFSQYFYYSSYQGWEKNYVFFIFYIHSINIYMCVYMYINIYLNIYITILTYICKI